MSSEKEFVPEGGYAKVTPMYKTPLETPDSGATVVEEESTRTPIEEWPDRVAVEESEPDEYHRHVTLADLRNCQEVYRTLRIFYEFSDFEEFIDVIQRSQAYYLLHPEVKYSKVDEIINDIENIQAIIKLIVSLKERYREFEEVNELYDHKELAL